MAEIRREFQTRYRQLLRAVLSLGRRTAVCTIYDAVPGIADFEETGLCLFNDVILREAFRLGVPVVDLRLICTERVDYSALSPIEPSTAGGAKICRAISRLLVEHDFQSGGSRVCGG